MSEKILVNPSELAGITSELNSVTQELTAAYNKLKSIEGVSFYLEGQAQAQVGMLPVAAARMEELISHYERLTAYVEFASETMVAVDKSISNGVGRKRAGK